MFETSTLRREQLALRGLSLSLLTASLDTSVANASLPALAMTFGASFQEAQWIVLAYLLAATSLMVGVGRLGDLAGSRRLLLTSITIFMGASVVSVLAPSLPVLIAARTVQGACAAAMTALTIAMVGNVVPTSRTGTAMGQLAAMSAVGTTLGPTLGSMLQRIHPRVVFLASVPLGAVAFVLSRRSLPEDRAMPSRAVSFDIAGNILLSLTLVSYALSMTLGHGQWSALNFEWLGAAIGGAIAFWVVERRAVAPLVPLETFRDRPLVVSLVANAVVSTVVMVTLIVGPFYLSHALALSPTAVGFVLSIGPAAAALTGTLAGRATQHFGSARTRVAGLAATLTGAVAIAILPASAGLAGYVAPLIVLTSGYAFFQTANNTAVMAGADDTRRGIVAALLGLSRNLGLITGTAAMGAVFIHAAGVADLRAATPDAVATAMRVTFAVAAFLVASITAIVVRQSLTDSHISATSES